MTGAEHGHLRPVERRVLRTWATQRSLRPNLRAKLLPVGLLCDYFAAPTDDIAASTIDWVGGPSQPGEGPKQGLFRRGS